MRVGKVSDSVLKRTVLKAIKTKREEVIKGAGVGEDCAFFSFEEGTFATCVTQGILEKEGDLERLMIRCANNLVTSMAEPVAVMLTLLLPGEYEESSLKNWMAEAENSVKRQNMQIAGGHTAVCPYVTKVVAILTGYGKPMDGELKPTGGILPGMDIVITKWIALEGSYLLARDYEEKLLKRYPVPLVEEVLKFPEYLSVRSEAAVAWKSGAVSMHDVSEGGVFSALWEMAESAGVGLSIELRKLPIRQETVEVCELLEKNPYELLGGGSLVIATEDGSSLVEALQSTGCPAVVVGKFTKGKEKLIFNEEEKRFMDRPAIDQRYIEF